MLMYKTDEPCWISNLRYYNFLTNSFALVRDWTNALCFDVISSNVCKYFHRAIVLPSLMHYITHNNYTVQEYIMFFLHIFNQGSGKKTDIESLIQIDNQQIYFLFPWLVQEVMILKLQTVGSC